MGLSTIVVVIFTELFLPSSHKFYSFICLLSFPSLSSSTWSIHLIHGSTWDCLGFNPICEADLAFPNFLFTYHTIAL
jgi:hypothetical protein